MWWYPTFPQCFFFFNDSATTGIYAGSFVDVRKCVVCMCVCVCTRMNPSSVISPNIEFKTGGGGGGGGMGDRVGGGRGGSGGTKKTPVGASPQTQGQKIDS